MANHSFVLCQTLLKNGFSILSILSVSLSAFSAHFPCPTIAGGVEGGMEM